MRLLRSLPVLLFLACQPGTVRTVEYPNGKAEIHLSGKTAESFRRITGHGALTPSENLIVYGTENPPSLRLKCHERQHQVDAETIADLLIKYGYLRDTDKHRFAIWLGVYLANHIEGYEENLLEERAREACAKVASEKPGEEQ